VLSTVIVLVVLHLMPLLVDPGARTKPDDQADEKPSDRQ